MQTQKDMVLKSAGHGILNIDVLSFGRLTYRIFDEVGGDDLPVLDDTGKSLVLRKVAADAALRYLHTSKDKRLSADLEVSFDVVAVTFDGGGEIVEWFPNAYYPMYL